MKKNPLLLLCLMTLIGCSDDYVDNLPMPNESTAQVSELNDVQKDIMINILASKYGGYNKNQKISRAVVDVSFKPYVEDGDTLMYIVQYHEGWELYSAKRCSNMLLFSSESGQLSLSDPNLPPALRTLINNSAAEIKENAIAYSDSIHPSWGTAALSTQDIEAGKTSIDSSKFTKIEKISRGEDTDDDRDDGSEDNEIQEGGWVLIREEIVSSNTYISDKLIKTKWGQSYPWNIYTPLLSNSNGNLTHSLAGCVAVALSQYMYYTHFKDCIPESTISSAYLDSNNAYIFSGESNTIWDDMATHWYNEGTNNSALLIGYIGKCLNTIYGLNSSGATIVDLLSQLNEHYSISNVNFTEKAINLSDISQSIRSSYPLIASALTKGAKAGHVFIIDKYTYSSTQTKYIYGWEGPYYANGAWHDTNDRDEDGNIIGWAITNEITRNSSGYSISMNWGWDGAYDDTVYNNISSWTAGNSTYNSNIYIYTRSDI